MANLLYSTQQVELSFEPPALRALFPLLDIIDDAHWRYLFDANTFEAFLVNALAGRNLNFNKHDESCVYLALDNAEVAARLAKGHRQIELAPLAQKRQVAVKLPDMNCYLNAFRRVAPDHSAVVMLRRPISILQSLVRMEWFTDARLSGISADWPHRKTKSSLAPHWVENQYFDAWVTWSPLERCCYYYCRMYDEVSTIDGIHLVSFEAFVANPISQFAKLVDTLGIGAGSQTSELLDGIYNPDKKYSLEIDGVSTNWWERMNAVHDDCLSRALIG
jgi:hypothetical protein